MESVYANDYLNIFYYEGLNTLSGVWNGSPNAEDYRCGFKNFQGFSQRIKPKHTLWNNRQLDARLCRDLQEKANLMAYEMAKIESDGKIAIILEDDLYTNFLMSDKYNELDLDAKLRYFQKEKNAIDWISSPQKNKDIFPKVKIKKISNHEFTICLKVSEDEVDEYVAILNRLLKSKIFCNENAEIFNSLTCREREVLRYIVKGFKNQDIADYLFLSVETVKTHRKNVLSKLNCQNAYALTQFMLFFSE